MTGQTIPADLFDARGVRFTITPPIYGLTGGRDHD
jgi:hypothetical protein